MVGMLVARTVLVMVEWMAGVMAANWVAKKADEWAVKTVDWMVAESVVLMAVLLARQWVERMVAPMVVSMAGTMVALKVVTKAEQ